MEQENDQEVTKAPGPAKHDSGAADLEKVTDYAEDKEISGENLDNAINAISSIHRKENDEKALREKQLLSVKVKKEDVDLLVNELEIAKPKAERLLKENNGDVQSALSAFINS